MTINSLIISYFVFMSKVVNTGLAAETEARSKRLVRRLGKTPCEMGAMLIEESLRQKMKQFYKLLNSNSLL